MPTFATPAPVFATIDIIAGDIRVVASERPDTVVDVNPRDESNGLDVKTAAETRVEYADGRLWVKSPKPLMVFFSGKSATVDVTVHLPTGSHVHGTTMHGDLVCKGRLGDCTFRTYDGDINLHQAHGVRLTTMSGRITADRVTGEAYLTGSGEVQLTQVDGAGHVKNLDGSSWIGQANGELHVNSAHGDIAIDRGGRRIVARTAHGNVRLAEVSGGEAVRQTASGEIEIGIRHGTTAWLDVKSSSGRVRNELDTSEAPQMAKQTARIRARTWAGDIVIRRAA